jgi:hypothetical protein
LDAIEFNENTALINHSTRVLEIQELQARIPKDPKDFTDRSENEAALLNQLSDKSKLKRIG